MVIHPSSDKPLVFDDPVYGKETISEPVLLDLIKSDGMARIKGLNQYGPPREWYHLDGFSRFDHCVGTMILLRRLGASLDEQIAGLIHDVSHYAFSHVADWVFGNRKQEDRADLDHLSLLRRFGIEKVLLSHDRDPSYVACSANFSLLESPSPSLCADRVDYFIREVAITQHDHDVARRLAASLINFHGRIVMSRRQDAHDLAVRFLECNDNHWCGMEAKFRYVILSEALRHSISAGVYKVDCLYGDDAYASEALRVAGGILSEKGDNSINDAIRTLESSLDFVPDKDGISLGLKKFRYVDPEFLLAGSPVRLSSVDNGFAALLDRSRSSSKEYLNVRPVIRR